MISSDRGAGRTTTDTTTASVLYPRAVFMRRAFRHAIRGLGGLALLSAQCHCAGSEAPRMTLDRAFAQIQRHEAAIAEQQLRASRPDLEPESAQRIAEEARDEAAALCRIAHEVRDRDALTRCAGAERAARGLAERAAVGGR
jgi:hypothetical protein